MTSDEQRAAWIGEAMRLHYVAIALRAFVASQSFVQPMTDDFFLRSSRR